MVLTNFLFSDSLKTLGAVPPSQAKCGVEYDTYRRARPDDLAAVKEMSSLR